MVIAGWLVTNNPFVRPVAVSDSLATLDALDAKSAYLRGVDLVNRDRSLAALPYFRAALGRRPDLWQIHADYASALMNSAVEVAPRRGILAPVIRSTRERVALVSEAFERFASAERLAPTPRDRAYVIRHRATGLAAWGLAWDASENERRAAHESAAGGSTGVR